MSCPENFNKTAEGYTPVNNEINSYKNFFYTSKMTRRRWQYNNRILTKKTKNDCYKSRVSIGIIYGQWLDGGQAPRHIQNWPPLNILEYRKLLTRTCIMYGMSKKKSH